VTPSQGWPRLGAYLQEPTEPEDVGILGAARADLDACRQELQDRLDADIALTFEVMESVFGDSDPRLALLIGDDRRFEITVAALLKAVAKDIDPVGLVACAVVVSRRRGGDSPILDVAWHPKRIGDATPPDADQMPSHRRIAQQPGLPEEIADSIARQQDVLILGPPASGRTALAAVVADTMADEYSVIWLTLSDPADGPETVVATLLRTPRRPRYLVVVDDLQANLPIVDLLFQCVTRLRQDFGLAVQVLATGWPAAAAALRAREFSFPLQPIRVDAAAAVRQMLDEADIRSDDRALLLRLADDDVHIAATAIDIYEATGSVPTEERLQLEFTKGVETLEEQKALYRLACLGVFGVVLPEREGQSMAGLVRRDLAHRTDGALTVAPRRRAELVMRYAQANWRAACDEKPEAIVWSRVRQSERLIRATLSQIDQLASPDQLRRDHSYLLSAHETSEKVGHWLAKQTERDATWHDNLGSQVFAAVALARLHRDEGDREWKMIADVVRRRWRYDDPDQVRLEPIGEVTTDFHDFEDIENAMRLEDAAYGEEGHPSGMNADDFNKDEAYRNWALGLILCMEGKAPLKYRDSGRIANLLRLAEKQSDWDGGFYPKRVPWVTARVVIGMCHADVESQNRQLIARSCEWLLKLVTEPGQALWWRSGTGSWNRNEATTAMCVTALTLAGARNRDRNAIDMACAWLQSRQAEWTREHREIDLAQVIEALSLSTESPVDTHLKMLIDRTMQELDAATPMAGRPEEQLRLPLLAAQLTDIVWRTVRSEFIRLLSDVMTPETPADAVATESSLPSAVPATAPPVRRVAAPALAEGQMHFWFDASEQLSQALRDEINSRSGPQKTQLPSVREALARLQEQRKMHLDLARRLHDAPTLETFREMDWLGREVCGSTWPDLPFPVPDSGEDAE